MNAAANIEPQCPVGEEGPRNLVVLPMAPPPAPPAPREIRIVTDNVAMFDTAKFEHMQRIAQLMAETSMIPDSLCMYKEGEETKRLPMRNVVANCFMVVNQAGNWGMDPFAVAQCASIVHGRLMWEGKLVAAVIKAKVGIRLRYTFVNDTPERKYDDQRLGVIVSGRFADETEDRTIEGTVSRWHKGGKSPWANSPDWKRQLRYMGAREWARAHAPDIMLGLVADDEANDFADDRPRSLRSAPSAKLVAAPDIPEEEDEAPAVTTAADPVAADADPVDDTEEAGNALEVHDFLKELRAERRLCASEQDLIDLRENRADAIARLPGPAQEYAQEILADEE